MRMSGKTWFFKIKEAIIPTTYISYSYITAALYNAAETFGVIPGI
jgi:hypothetical protein